MQIELTGKVAIVTGAASGIGLSTVISYLDSNIMGIVAVDIAPELPPVLTSNPRASRLRYVRGDVGVEQTAIEFTQTAMTRVWPNRRAGEQRRH